MKSIIRNILNESLKVKERFIKENVSEIILFAEKIVMAFTNDRKLMICGNGGSAAEAQHIAAEFISCFEMERPPLPAIALTTDTSILTRVGNDGCFDDVFAKQVKAIGMEGDILLIISTSGNSRNTLEAARTASSRGIHVAALTGGDGGKLAGIADSALIVQSDSAPRVQETHIIVGHIICQLVDYILFQQGIPAE